MKHRRIFLFLILVIFSLALFSCAENWGEEMTYLRLTDGTNTQDWGITAGGELMKLVPDYGKDPYDFSDCDTGDILQVEIYLIQEIFPSNAVYHRIKPTGKQGDISLNESCQGWLDETIGQGVWTIEE